MALAGLVPVGLLLVPVREPLLLSLPLQPRAGKDSAIWTSCDITPSSNSFAKLFNSSHKCWSLSCNNLAPATLNSPS